MPGHKVRLQQKLASKSDNNYRCKLFSMQRQSSCFVSVPFYPAIQGDCRFGSKQMLRYNSPYQHRPWFSRCSQLVPRILMRPPLVSCFSPAKGHLQKPAFMQRICCSLGLRPEGDNGSEKTRAAACLRAAPHHFDSMSRKGSSETFRVSHSQSLPGTRCTKSGIWVSNL